MSSPLRYARRPPRSPPAGSRTTRRATPSRPCPLGAGLTPRRRAAMLARPAPVAARRLGRGVGKPDALELNLSTHAGERHGIGRILHGHRLVQHTKDAFGAGHSRLEDIVLLGEGLDRPEESLGIFD